MGRLLIGIGSAGSPAGTVWVLATGRGGSAPDRCSRHDPKAVTRDHCRVLAEESWVIGQHSLTLLADMPFNRLGHIAASRGEKPVAHQRARLTVGAYHRCHAAGLIEQVPDLAKIVRRHAGATARTRPRSSSRPGQVHDLVSCPG